MTLQPLQLLGTRARRALKSTHAESEPECLRCRHRFDANDLSHVHSTGDNRTYIECVWCEARNEVRATAQAGASAHTVVMRIMTRRRQEDNHES